MEKENQRVVITKRMLKEGILKLLQRKELDAINVTELCREAGVNRATFYRHYEIPRDVLMEIQQDLSQQLKLPKSPEDIRPVVEQLCIYMNANQELFRVLILNNSDTDFTSFINDTFLELAKEYHHMPALKKLSREDIHFISLYGAGGSYFVLRSWLLGSFQKTPQEMASYVCSLFSKTEELLIAALSERNK